MKRFFVAVALSLVCLPFALAQSGEINIIPRPLNVSRTVGHFEINADTRIVVEHSKDRDLANYLNKTLKVEHGVDVKVASKTTSKQSKIFISRPDDYQIIGDGYLITVENKLLNIEAATAAGRFYAVQTLLQMLIKDGDKTVVLNANVTDHARFRYRGMHLDVARHFMPVEFVKKYIDLMAQYKFNYFHWHLTEDQGWRIEIKKYPKLTEIGSRRPETMVDRNFSPYIGDGIPHGGFYTQEQIKEVVAYAKERHITVIPEIELPGHASAALAAYPQFGCKADHEYKVQTTWGIFKEVFCPTEETFRFLEDVLDETIALFPDSPYIHIGGDEVLKDHWKESEFVQELMKRENLKDENEVQSYFIRRIERHINKRGKKMIGWDEILEGGLAPNATVMSWRGMRGGIEAAKAGHDVIMTPTDYAYFDYGQGDPAYEPLNIGSYVPLSKVYSFEPVPPELTADEAKYVIGGQANVWTEYMKTPSHVEYMAFPRMLALSEVLWSQKEHRDFADFQRRLWTHLPRLDKQNVNYRIPEPGGLENIVTEKERVSIKLQPAAGTRVYYTTDGSTPDERSPVYSKPIEIRLIYGEVKTLKTIVVNAVGRKSVVYAATIVRGKKREPDGTNASRSGLKFEIGIPGDDPGAYKQWETGETRSTSLNQFAQRFDLKKPFLVIFDGYFRVPEDGIYEFQVDSTWNASVVLGSRMIIEKEGTGGRSVKSAIVPLRAGLHKMSIRYNHGGGDSSFRFRWGIKGRGLTQAWGGEFVH
ncbi:MAG TPA: family 20 glycosylhydrolase [Pyrinomonadaceae bacterium]|nr:family 20 glycosylhydrolase [Pyrinomonadaceae bacterium]